MASWEYCLEPLEKLKRYILLELKALHEGTWKMGEFMVFSQQLVMQVTPELRALLKVVEGASRTPGNVYQCPTIQAYVGYGRHVGCAQRVALPKQHCRPVEG